MHADPQEKYTPFSPCISSRTEL